MSTIHYPSQLTLVTVAPFTEDQIRALKLYQVGPMHPYTCSKCSLDLVPIVKGLQCNKCGFIQKWAFEGTTDFEKVKAHIKGVEKFFSNPV